MLQRMLFLLNEQLSPILGAEQGMPAVTDGAADVIEGVQQAAAAAPPPQQNTGLFGFGGGWEIFLIWGGVIAVFYFLTIRPQRKRDKKMKEMQSSIKVGDNVLTSGGMYGRIADVGHDCFVVEFGTNRGVRIPIRKSDVLTIQTPQMTPPPSDK